MSGDDARARADELVATKFTRVMNATPSRWGVLGDVLFAGFASSVILIVGLALAGRFERPGPVLAIALVLAALPLAFSFAVSLLLRGSRELVVTWLASVPFPIENLNALLAGLGDTLEVFFAEGTALPERAELQPLLDEISGDILVVRSDPEQRLVEIRLGILDSKRNPQAVSHRRWLRLVDTVEKVLVPLSRRHPIETIQIV